MTREESRLRASGPLLAGSETCSDTDGAGHLAKAGSDTAPVGEESLAVLTSGDLRGGIRAAEECFQVRAGQLS